MEISGKKAIAGHSQPQATAELYADLRKMLNNPEFSDVLFVCQDGVQVFASRLLIMARSSVLKSMLVLKKNKEGQIALPDISSSVLLSIFEFLYTGTMTEHAPRSSVQAYQVISAARYFQLEKIEEMIREFLVNSTAKVGDDMYKAALRLSVALEFGTHSGTVDAVPAYLVRVLNSADLEPTHLRGLSEKAFRYFLQKTKNTTHPTMLSFGEYLRFRQIILWCATQVCPDEASQVVKSSIPDPRSALSLLKDAPTKLVVSSSQPNSEELSEKAGYLKSLLVNRPESAALVDSLLTLVDFRRIHAELLDAVVEPLKIVPPAQLMAAFRFQALQKNTRLATAPQFHWEHGSSYAVQGDGHALVKSKPTVGFARFSVPISRPYGVYEWDVIVEELCVEFCEIGFYNVPELQDGKPNFTGNTLSQQPTGWAISNDIENGTRINQRGGDNEGWVPFKKDFAHKDARIRVRLDMFSRSCSISVDNDEFSAAWINLPQGIYYPAVSLGVGTLGRVRIELVSGYDML